MGKKAEQKKKDKIVEDKTFGLKNKNRSSKVQAYVQQVKQTVNQTRPQDKKAMAEAEERRIAKEAKKAREAEMAALFRDADNAAKKTGSDHEEGPAAGEDGEEFVYDPDAYLFRPEDFDEVAHDERRLEERLEEEREALQGRTDLTPVTEESFQKWKQEKREQAAAAELARVKRAKAGEGKLKGWDLWQMDQDLFIDDEDADEFYEREELEEGEEEEEEAYDLS
ncbi:hypothetical protein STCU_00246 [Strigomonas culicis]|uniref:CCCH-type Zn-finger protein n=1 Tax=Strigomonas culicis TaxID=28005 RepID=S9VF53_9TRYP|nr:hypothetical protein STCU_08502 [Strigomonas culicis]EPY24002.1 CCCH-type Zn-finger protein [Strigomonas culicis]EPY37051.1 hypothetical protein STCU_00246 [Strigomonas culicis]|eukprot:EPY21760.1 hypothetical protein STCU_08502 [Strigomonas culicis]